MSLISRLLHEVNDEEKQAGESQCFIGHEFRHKDLRVKLERALDQLGLQAYFADKEVTGEFILTKVCKKILVTRASIVDLTTANPNVYFEFGVAIGLNKPIFVVLKRGAPVPPLLENFVKLRFTHYAGLERELVEQVPGWLEQSIEHHLLYNTHCYFVNVLCPDRQRITPQRRYLVIDQIESTDETGQPILTHDPDLRAELPAALDRFHFDPIFLSDVPLQDTFRLCDYCRALRDSSFALCHLSRRTSPNVHLLLGLVTGLNIPSLLMVHEERRKDGQPLFQVPTMLRGLDAFYYEHAVDIAERLGDEVEGFLNRQRSEPITEKKLAFPDLTRRFVSEEPIEGELGLTASLPAEFSELLGELTSLKLDFEELLVRVTDRAIEAVEGAESDTLYCTILLFDMSEEKLLTVAARGYPRGSIESVVGKSFEMSEGVVGFVARTRRSMLIDDVGAESRYLELLPDVRSELAVPLIDTDRQLIGVINLESPQAAYFREEHARSIEVLAGAAAVAIQKVARRTRLTTVRETLGRVQSITDPSQQSTAMVALLDDLAEIRDTEGIRRVVEIALTITTTDAQIQILRAAARAYENLGETQKARQVANLLSEPQFAYDVFISYSHHDSEWVGGWLLPRLEDAGLSVCIDYRDFEVGLPIIVNMERAVEQSRKTLLVLTPEYLTSQWANFESSLVQISDPVAWQSRVIPLLLRPAELPAHLGALMYADFTQPSTEETRMRHLIAAIRDQPVPEQFGEVVEQVRSAAGRIGAWLEQLGFVRNPFMELAAEREPGLPEYFVQGPFFDELLGPHTSILFAARGHGKTAYRLVAGEMLKTRNNLVVNYVNFNPLPVTPEDHVRALIKLINPQTSVTPLPGLVSPVEALARTCVETLKRTGRDNVYILVDGIDELLKTAGSGQAAADLVLPLLADLRLMELPTAHFKFFLPLEIRHFILQSPSFRLDRIAAFELKWTEVELLEMLRWRLSSASGDKIRSLDAISHPEIAGSIDEQLVRASNGSPRQLIRLGQLLLEAHLRRPSEGVWLTGEDLGEALEHFHSMLP